MQNRDVLAELTAREPIFHRPAFARTPEHFAKLMTSDYWEIGASGQRYDRTFILELLKQNPPTDAEAEGWTCSNFELRELPGDTYLLTYNLNQRGRHTRRATLWQRRSQEWQILYHQGTIMRRI